MGVVELDSDFFVEAGKVVTLHFTAAKFGSFEATDNVLKSGGTEEVFLFEAKVFAFSYLFLNL